MTHEALSDIGSCLPHCTPVFFLPYILAALFFYLLIYCTRSPPAFAPAFYLHKSLSRSLYGSPFLSFRSQLICPLLRGTSLPTSSQLVYITLLFNQSLHLLFSDMILVYCLFACFFPLFLSFVTTLRSKRRRTQYILFSTGSPAPRTVSCTDQVFKKCAK